MPVEHVFASLPVADLESAAGWYERLLGRPPDLVPADYEVAWQLAAGGWIYVVRDADRAGATLVTLLVDDLDGALEAAAARGVEPAAAEEASYGRKAFFRDPSGNEVALAQPTAG